MAIGGIIQKWKEQVIQAGSNSSLGGTVKAALLDVTAVGQAITGATNATPIVITSNSHGLSNGDLVAIFSVGGNTAANGVWRVANVATNTYELTDPDTGSNVAGSGAYTSGGRMLPLGTWQFYSDLSAGVVGTPVALTTKTYAKGVFDADDVTFTSVTGNACAAVVFYIDTGTGSTSRLVYLLASGTGLPVTPNSGNITITFNASGLWRL